MSGLSVAEVLERAADLIEPEGKWTQGCFVDNIRDCYCAVGAIGIAIGNGEWPGSFVAENWVNRYWPIEGQEAEDLEDWNDAPRTNQAEVVAKLREAAALAREQGK